MRASLGGAGKKGRKILRWTSPKIKRLVVLNARYWQWVCFLQAGRAQDSPGVCYQRRGLEPPVLAHLAGALETPSLGVVCEPASRALVGNYGCVVNELLEPPCLVLAAAARRSLTALDCCCSMGRGVPGFGALEPLTSGGGGGPAHPGLACKLGFKA